MNIYYTIDEKYLKAIDKLCYNTPKAKILLEEILDMEPGYGKAHFQLGCIYTDELAEYHLAVRHFELAMKFEPEFPETYIRLLRLFNGREEYSSLLTLADKALKTKGVCKSCVHYEQGLAYEKQQQWDKATAYFRKAVLHGIAETDVNQGEVALERVRKKLDSIKTILYVLV